MSGHHHHHHSSKNKKSLIWAMVIIGSWMFIELIGGLLTGSLALLADAGHMFSDFFNLLISFLAIVFATKAATNKKTFGNHRLEILAALMNALMLIGVSVYIVLEAIERLASPTVVSSGPMMIIAIIGLVANIGALMVLSGKNTKENLNMRGAYLHVLGDTLGSVSAILASALIMAFQWYWADPLLSLLIAVLIALTSVRLLKETLHVLMEGTPSDIHIEELKKGLTAITGVVDVHDLHVWSLSSDVHNFSCHLVIDNTASVNHQRILKDVDRWVSDHFNIQNRTIQIESVDNFNCTAS
ncbi:cation diffusion facilitator family transporter [Salipaludibacillus sp. LMS25]|jgi:cobalt-zinc-cadmium efflux system protein|uniref:cation diffusion facilitator family transporter n=1 Tax=Salipaludibacillus sp. LMS25 TaxID=2924031 RepID=UPI0020D1E607|nr:cation diffusion facilitator family transporter [Salipaludibacillus sp. LMS25]UTR16449.1 cation diffusion facilitator family transporter [Salipaludibacillus sp. LMS25]